MANNKIIYNGNTLIDLTGDTVTAADVAQGKTFHLPNGEQDTGTAISDTITDCRYLFALSNNRINSLINTQITTGQVSYMFYRNSSLTDTILDSLLSNLNYDWTLSNFDMSGFLQQCASITRFDFNNIDTANLNLNLRDAFRNCSGLTSITFKPNMLVRTAADMFNGCTRLPSIDLNISNVITDGNASGMFQHCTSLTSVTFNQSIGTPYNILNNLFSSCTNLTTLTNVEYFIQEVSNGENMFFACSSLPSIKLPYFKMGNRPKLSYMFYNCSALTTIDLLWDCSTSSASNTSYMFSGCNSLQNLVIRWTGGVPTITSYDTISSIPTTCNIYVPDDLVESYKTATNWSYKKNQIKPLSEYVEE